MLAGSKSTRSWLLGSVLMLGWPLMTAHADATPAKKRDQKTETHQVATRPAAVKAAPAVMHGTAKVVQAKARPAGRSYGMSCVPYARMVSGIAVPGNAWQWWGNAAGVYARGTHPEPNGILVFRSNPHMRLGHVAVVREVVNAREVVIDHSNWPSGGRGVAHHMAVVDVSDANDWSAVRVELGGSGSYGSVYPTYGFIYSRPDHGVMEAAATAPAPRPDLNPAPRDLRPVAERPWRTYEEVAEAPNRRTHSVTLSAATSR
jgi:surface antigen